VLKSIDPPGTCRGGATDLCRAQAGNQERECLPNPVVQLRRCLSPVTLYLRKQVPQELDAEADRLP